MSSPGNSRESGRYSCSRLTSPPPTSPLEVEGGRHSYLPPLAPSRPPQPAASHSYTTLTNLDGKVENEGGGGGGGQEERVEEVRGRRERMTSREEMMEVKLRLGKDEKRAREGGIMLDVKVIRL